jgi:hypothetical protein
VSSAQETNNVTWGGRDTIDTIVFRIEADSLGPGASLIGKEHPADMHRAAPSMKKIYFIIIQDGALL